MEASESHPLPSIECMTASKPGNMSTMVADGAAHVTVLDSQVLKYLLYERIGYFEATPEEEESDSDDQNMQLDIPIARPDFPTQLLGQAEVIVIQ